MEERESVRKTAAAEFAGFKDSLPAILASGQFKRQYRDHRLEWMMRSGGAEIVIEGMKNSTVRFSREIE